MIRQIFLVAAGGALGSAMRYLSFVLTSRFFSGGFPLATFLTNVLGCLLIGILMGFFARNNMENSSLKWLLVTGFCGGYTTFSTFGYETVSLVSGQQYMTAFAYVAASVLIGLAAVFAGLWLMR
jgi:CrcB protein